MATQQAISLPSQSTPIIDRYRRWNPVWWKWVKPALEAVNDHTQQLKAVSDDLETVNASIDEERQVRADADGALAQSIETLEANYQNDDAALNAAFTAAISEEQTARANADGALASTISNLDADYKAADFTLNSKITDEATARSNADGGLSSRITTIESTYQTADSALDAKITAEQSARIAADGVNATNISNVSTTVNNHTTTISEQATSINGLQGKWGVSINSNGRVTGLSLNSGLNSYSQFAVQADKFVIVHQSDNSKTIQAFISGLVNGIATVGINGNLVVDNTISGDKIQANTLSELTSNAGIIVNGILRNSADSCRFDIAAMRWYRTDGTAEINLQTKVLDWSF